MLTHHFVLYCMSQCMQQKTGLETVYETAAHFRSCMHETEHN